MTDFNYNEFSTDVLVDALKREESQIKWLQSDCKFLDKKIQRGRGYSLKKLDGFARSIEIKQALIRQAQQEVAELQSVIAQRLL